MAFDHEISGLKHALVVAYHYPPEASSSGVLRTLKYTRYLGAYGWRATVITLRADAYEVVDEGLSDQIPADVRVVRTSYVNTKRHLAVRGVYPALLALPDTWIGWLPWAVAAGRRVLREDPVDVIYSTSPHATSHLVALRLASASRLPWVTDFRDPWIEDPPEPGAPNGLFYRHMNRYLERRVVEACTRIVTSTTGLGDSLRERYANLPAGKITAILNGYDEADFSGLPPAPLARSDFFTITHAGSINADFRDPRPLFSAMRAAAQDGALDIDRVRVRFIGGGGFADSPAIKEALRQTGLAERVEFLPRLPYEDTLQQLGRADVLLLLQASEDTITLVPAKLYEYLRTQRPVLALVQPGASAEVLATIGGGWAVDPRDANALTRAIGVAFAAWRSGTLQAHCADLEILRRFDRKVLTGQLAAVFDSVLSSGSRVEG